MNRVYNFYNLEALFRNYLSAGNKKAQPITIKNYLSDLRHFLGWFVLRLKSKEVQLNVIDSSNLSFYLTREEIAHYKAYLEKNSIPLKTINRRLSTLRKFCSFCISQRWIAENPAKHIKNIAPFFNPSEIQLKNDLVLEEFRKNLEDEGLDRQESQKTLETVLELLSLSVG